MLYTNQSINQFFIEKETESGFKIITFNESALLELTTPKFMEELADKILLFQIERITINQKENCMLIYIFTNENQIIYAYINDDGSYFDIRYIPSFVLNNLGLTVVDMK